MTRPRGAIARFKTARRAKGKTACDVCSWRAPEAIRRNRASELALMDAHHVIPIVCGGPDDESNLVLLCRNCHAIAHALGDGRYDPNGKWSGIAATPAELVHLVKSSLGLLPIPLPNGRKYFNHRPVTLCPE